MEEIIIDGVNVWSCKHYDLENNYCDQSYLGEGGLLKNTKNPKRCECSPNCYYKQLKRLEQENAELKETIKKYSKINEQETKDYAELLKETNKYRKALEEIKNNCVEMLITIAEEGKPNGAIVDTIWCKNIPCCTLFELIENTQRKINEVLND